MNEIRDLLIGVDFGRTTSQICYFDRKAEEAVSISMKVGGTQYEAPTVLCRKAGRQEFCVGLEADYFAREQGGFLVENFYDQCCQRQPVQAGDGTMQPWELLAAFLKEMLKFLGMVEPVKYIKCLGVTVPVLENALVENLQEALRSLGFGDKQFFILDYGESFYYYAMGQKQETWNRYVGWYAFDQNAVSFRRLSMNISSRPVLVRLEPEICTTLEEEAEARDLQYYQFVQDTLKNDLYSSVLITGKGFDTQWAEKSVKTLCKQHRKVFFGNNLFAKGACIAGRERREERSLKNYLYVSESLVTENVGMDMMIMGSPAYYSLIEAGRNWYECHAEYELILDRTEELVFVVTPMGENKKRKISMALPGLPVRPNRTTRLRVSMKYISRTQCEILVQDLGFGQLFPTSGKVWKECVQWQGGES